MAAPPSQPPARSSLSLYANLLESDDTASLSRDPAFFKEESKDDASKKAIDPALRFQPIRRPQIKQPSKPKPGFPKAPPAIPTGAAASASGAVAGPAPVPAPASASAPAPARPRGTLADWAATEEDEYLYGAGEKRQRGGRRKKKKKLEQAPRETDWDEIYDPARPTNVEEYLHSEERIREVQGWKALLYAHRRRARLSSYGSDGRSDEEGVDRPRLGNQFAPPPSLTFAPPPLSPPRAAQDDATGGDAYARRLAMSGIAPPPPAELSPSPPPPPPAPEFAHQPAPPPPPPPPIQPPTATAAATAGATISRAPVRYEASPAPDTMDVDPRRGPNQQDEEEEKEEEDHEVDYASIPLPPPKAAAADDDGGPRTNRPGQKGFARRFMAKYGWTKGAGLGASESGITSALRVQVEKRRRRPDAEGGGFAEPGGRGRIILPSGAGSSSNRNKKDENNGEEGGGGGINFGKMSVVVVLRNMLENMADLRGEVEAGLGQEIGEECGERYGRVERLFIDVEGRRVFIKFTDAVSALRAVNALEGRIFNGNAIAARFYDEDKFEEGNYDG